jgi:hypothetical protein
VGFTQIFADEERGNGLSMWVFDDWILNGGNDLFSGFFFTQIFADEERGKGLSMWVFGDWILNGGNDLFS